RSRPSGAGPNAPSIVATASGVSRSFASLGSATKSRRRMVPHQCTCPRRLYIDTKQRAVVMFRDVPTDPHAAGRSASARQRPAFLKIDVDDDEDRTLGVWWRRRQVRRVDLRGLAAC